MNYGISEYLKGGFALFAHENPERIRITCRSEGELVQVKEAAEKTKVPGARMLRDQLHPVKVDNANRTAILEESGQVRPGVGEMLEKENEVKIGKISWLSRKVSTTRLRLMARGSLGEVEKAPPFLGEEMQYTASVASIRSHFVPQRLRWSLIGLYSPSLSVTLRFVHSHR